MQNNEYSLEDILMEFSDKPAPPKNKSEGSGDFLMPEHKKPEEPVRKVQPDSPTEKLSKAIEDEEELTVPEMVSFGYKKPPKKELKSLVNGDGDIKIYDASHAKKAPPAENEQDKETKPKKKSKPKEKHAAVKEKQPKEPRHLEDEYETYEKKKVPYDIICGFEEDPALGAKHCTKKIIRFSLLSGISLPVVITAFIMSFYTYIPLPDTSFVKEALAIIDPLRELILLICLGIMAVVSIEIIVSGIYRLVIFSPTLDTVIAANTIVALAYGIQSMLLLKTDRISYSAISCLILMMAVKEKRNKLITLKRNYIAATLSTAPLGVKLNGNGKHAVVSKTSAGSDIDCKKISLPTLAESFACIVSPVLLVVPPILSVLICIKNGSFVDFLFDYSAISTMFFSLGFITASSKAEYKLGKKLFTSGTSFVDNSQLRKLCKARSAIVTDRDIFPAGSVEITGLKVVGHQSLETVLAYGTALFEQIGGGAHKAFYDMAKSRYVTFRQAKNIHFYESGGISATISGDNVLLGNAAFLMRMGVNITHGTNMNNNIFMAVNSSISAIFAISYSETSNTSLAFEYLKRLKIRPVIASLDFQITPMLIESAFDLGHDFVVYPDVEDRIALSAGSYGENEPPVAVLSRDNLHSFAEVLAYGKLLYKTARFNIICSCVSALMGVFFMYFFLSSGEINVASVYNVFMFLILWYIPVMIKNLSTNKI